MSVSRTIRIGPAARRLFVVDDVVEQVQRASLFQYFRSLAYELSNADRMDTQAYRHLCHRFEDEELTAHPVIEFFADASRSVLRKHRVRVARLKRAVVNFNLYGDVQFAHEDGDEWTVVAFVNDVWHSDWGGELLVYDEPASQLAYAVEPAPGRIAIFDGLLQHRGGVPSRVCTEPRITLALKFAR